jgi:PAS domain-containing protein
MAEFGLMVVLVFLINQVVFFEWLGATGSMGEHIFKGYWLFAVIVLVAMHFKCHGVGVLLLMTAAQALNGIVHEVGYFAHDHSNTGLITFWTYTIALSGVGMVVTVNLVQRTRAAQLRAESDEIYRLLVATMSEGVVLQDEGGKILAFNQSADQLRGKTSMDPHWYAIHEDGSPYLG